MPLWGLLGEAKANGAEARSSEELKFLSSQATLSYRVAVATNAFISRWPPNLRGQFLLVCSCFVIFYTAVRIHALLLLYLVAREDYHIPSARVHHASLLIPQSLHGHGYALGR